MRLRTDWHLTVKLAVLGAMAIVLSAMENLLLPELPFMLPGTKPGLSNVVTMFVASEFPAVAIVYIIMLKAVFVLMTKGATAFLMSLAGGALSGLVIVFLFRLKLSNISYIGISVLAAVAHNIGQLTMSMLYTGSAAMMNYIPLLLIFAVISGTVTGILLQILLPKIQSAITACIP